MSSTPKPTSEEMRVFAQRYGLGRLSDAHLDRMAELAVYVTDLGRDLPRPANKEDKLPSALVFRPR